jgi:vesicular inhibitory amino acid transporter
LTVHLSITITISAAGGIACYTGRLLAKCMNTSRAIRTYPDIGQAAFGRWGRLLVSVLLYLELFCCCVDFLILEGALQHLPQPCQHLELSEIWCRLCCG